MFTLLADWKTEGSRDLARESERMLDAHRRYQDYLVENKSRFPDSAFALASAEWRNDFSDHRAPHDSWVSEVRFSHPEQLKNRGRSPTSLEIILLGAYHDGHLHLRYHDLKSFSLSGSGLNEVYRDEVRLSESGHVLHEFEFLGRENWIVVCSDIEWEWRELSGAAG